MTSEFLLLADLVLLLRLRLLFADQNIGGAKWLAKGAIEAVTAIALLDSVRAWGAVIALAVVLNLAAWLGERRGRERNALQLLLGVAHLLALSFAVGPAMGAVFRPWVGELASLLREGSVLGPALTGLFSIGALKFVFGLLIAANEANLLIRWVLGRLQLRPGTTAATGIDAAEYARGRVIGLLERALIYFFVLNGQFGAVGFTLAAKGFTRFKELENRGFAEYVLIGTLLSSGIALLVAVAVQRI